MNIERERHQIPRRNRQHTRTCPRSLGFDILVKNRTLEPRTARQVNNISLRGQKLQLEHLGSYHGPGWGWDRPSGRVYRATGAGVTEQILRVYKYSTVSPKERRVKIATRKPLYYASSRTFKLSRQEQELKAARPRVKQIMPPPGDKPQPSNANIPSPGPPCMYVRTLQ